MQSDPLTPGTSIPPRPARPPAVKTGPAGDDHNADPSPVTRAGVIWAATVTALVLLSLLIVFILQNQDPVQVQYFGLIGSLPLGIALFIAAVVGGFLVAIAGAVRITQLRMATHVRHRPAAMPLRAQGPLLRRRHHIG
jgi:uncharacterized integral membrane protein